MTVTARSVAAAVGSNGCVIASSFVSASTFASRSPGSVAQCSIYNVEYWKNFSANGQLKLNPKIGDYLGHVGSSYDTKTIAEVLAEGGSTAVLNGQLGVLQHLLAMALASDFYGIGSANGFNKAYLQGVWANYITHGTYSLPASGILWNESQIITWLRMLMYPT
jgi:hypothetical protein